MKLFCYFEAQTIYFDRMNLISFTYPCSLQSPLIFNLVVKEKEIYTSVFCLMCTVNYSCTMHNIFFFFFFTILNSENKFVQQDLSHLCILDLTILITSVVIIWMSIMIILNARQHRPIQTVGSGTRHVSYLFGHENRLHVKLEGKPDKIGGTYGWAGSRGWTRIFC